jgi:hypothetical protein
MSYILDIVSGIIEPHPDRISLERYLQESSYITLYLSRLVKDKSLMVYQILFHFSWFELGKGELIITWARVGSFIRSDQDNIVEDTSTVKRRLSPLFTNKCIAVNRRRSGANEISVFLPSDIPACRELLDRERQSPTPEVDDTRDYFSDRERRLVILSRDRNACVYCTNSLAEDNFVLDHVVPVAKGGTNRKQNLVAACEPCNRRRGESDPIDVLRENYRQQLLTQDEFLRQKSYLEKLFADGA